jgi:hypothetical protein
MKFLTFLALLFILGPLGNAQAKPNVLFLAIDDLNDWIGCLGGHPQVKTPNLGRSGTWQRDGPGLLCRSEVFPRSSTVPWGDRITQRIK